MNKKVYLNKESESIQYLCKQDKRLAKVISMVGEITYLPHSDGFSFILHEIIEQMLSKKVATVIYERLSNLCDGVITPEAIHKLSIEEIRSTGTSNRKATYIHDLASEIISGNIDLQELSVLSDDEVVLYLTNIPGIGTWTAKMYLIFVLDRQNVLPFEDSAFAQSFTWIYKTAPSPANIKNKCRKWSPYSSIGARYLYRALDLGFTKNAFHLYKE